MAVALVFGKTAACFWGRFKYTYSWNLLLQIVKKEQVDVVNDPDQ
jgi:hypothetical protein